MTSATRQSSKKMINRSSRKKATNPEKEKRDSNAQHEAISARILDTLYETITSRKGADPALSHSARILSRGRKKIAQKFGEEAVECLIEAVAGKNHELISESADVLYHLIVMWVDAGVTPLQVWEELKRREAQSGIEEKASRISERKRK